MVIVQTKVMPSYTLTEVHPPPAIQQHIVRKASVQLEVYLN